MLLSSSPHLNCVVPLVVTVTTPVVERSPSTLSMKLALVPELTVPSSSTLLPAFPPSMMQVLGGSFSFWSSLSTLTRLTEFMVTFTTRWIWVAPWVGLTVIVPTVLPLTEKTRVKLVEERPLSSKVPLLETLVEIEELPCTLTVIWPLPAARAPTRPGWAEAPVVPPSTTPCRVKPPPAAEGPTRLLVPPQLIIATAASSPHTQGQRIS